MLAGIAESGGRSTLKKYVKRPGDRPAIEFMYFIYAPNNVRGLEYQTIADVGLEWPAELQAIDELLS